MNLRAGTEQLAESQVGEQTSGLFGRLIGYFAGHPKGFWFFFWGEFAERCSYYGMRAILAKYMADQLALGQENSGTYMSFFIAGCYFLPLVGGWVADRFFGKYWTIVGFSLPYILGHVILGIENYWCLVIALSLLAMGSGVIKPNISTLMGLTYDQQRPGQTKLRSDAFAMFYFAINVGAAISQFAMPPIRSNWGYATAFLFPAALMVVAFLIFAAGKKYYANEVIEHKETTPEERAERWRVLGRIFGLFLLVMFFWAIFDQSSSTWIFFTEACMDRHMFGFEFDPDQLGFINPVLILVLLPPITLLWRYLDGRGWRIRPTDKMIAGFFLTAGCMGVMALAGWLAGAAELRPGLADAKENKKIRMVIEGNKQLVFDEEMKIDAINPGAIVASYPVKDESGKKTNAKVKLKIIGEGVLKLRAAPGQEQLRDQTTLQVEGNATEVIKSVKEPDKEETKETLVRGSLKATFIGEMDVSQRWFVDPKDQVTVWWLALAYVIITTAEVLISVTGLELAYIAAPKSMTGFVTACWLLTVGLANLIINAPVTRLYTKMQPMVYFGLLAGMMVVIAAAFVFVAKRFNRYSHEASAA